MCAGLAPPICRILLGLATGANWCRQHADIYVSDIPAHTMHKAGYLAPTAPPLSKSSWQWTRHTQNYFTSQTYQIFFRATAGVASAATPRTADLTPPRTALSLSLSLFALYQVERTVSAQPSLSNSSVDPWQKVSKQEAPLTTAAPQNQSRSENQSMCNQLNQ